MTLCPEREYIATAAAALGDRIAAPTTADQARSEAAKCDRRAAALFNAGEDALAGELIAQAARLYTLATELEKAA